MCQASPVTGAAGVKKSTPIKYGPWISDPRKGEDFNPFDTGDRESPFNISIIFNKENGSGQLRILNLGIERWEDGKRSDTMWERWELTCGDQGKSQATSGIGIYCKLERLIVMRGFSIDSSIVGIEANSTEDGTLKVNRIDWKSGVLDFDLIGGRAPIQCEVRFESKKPDGRLLSLRAISVVRTTLLPDNTLVNMEYRAAPYSFVLNVPLEMHGLKTAKQGKWDELIESLSTADRDAWKELIPRYSAYVKKHATDKQDDILAFIKPFDPQFAELVAEATRSNRELSDQERQKLKKVGREFNIWFYSGFLRNSKLSSNAQKLLVDFLVRE